MLLLLTGMETDLALINKARRAALSVSVAGMVVPFLCGFAAGQYLPPSILPRPDQRLITSLFLGTALPVASVKIVAKVVREMNFMRRNVGITLVASAIIDDTVGWTVVAITSSLASHGTLDATVLAQSVFGTGLFLLASFTLGRRLVFILILWRNDVFVSEVPVVTAILIVMGLMALVTHLIGVSTVLGAFVAGILVGESPILTRHIDEQLRGLVVALFMPVFFSLAGLNADLSILKHPQLVLIILGLIAIASVGKFAGAFIGGAHCPLAVAVGRGRHIQGPEDGSFNVLVPVRGCHVSRRAAEVGLALARMSNSPMTALYVLITPGLGALQHRLRRPTPTRRHEEAVLDETVDLADRYGRSIGTALRLDPEDAILRQARVGNYDLIVMGVGRPAGETLFFGEVAAGVLDNPTVRSCSFPVDISAIARQPRRTRHSRLSETTARERTASTAPYCAAHWRPISAASSRVSHE
jgi:nucleotide-binding universal stress UspA family protein